MFHGRLPTGMVAVTLSLAVSITLTVPSLPFDTYTVLPSGFTVTPFEKVPAGIFARSFCAAVSIAYTVPAISAAT